MANDNKTTVSSASDPQPANTVEPSGRERKKGPAALQRDQAEEAREPSLGPVRLPEARERREGKAAREATSDRVQQEERKSRQLRVPQEQETDRNEAMAQARARLQERYVSAGHEYRFREAPTRVAFREEGKKLTTEYNSAEVARGMVDAAQSKGWKTLRVNGTEEFKRQVWMEAEMRGVEVQGYKATEQDRKAIEDARAVRDAQRNVMAKWNRREGREQSEPEAGSQAATRPGREAAAAQPKPEQVVAMGAANYKFDKDENASYYLRLRSADGKEREVWGKDLERAAADAGIKVGDAVRVKVEKTEAVKVQGPVRDEQQQVVGREWKQAHANQWKIEKVDVARETSREALEQVMAKRGMPEDMRAKVRNVADAKLAERAAEGKTPQVQVYDRAAPREVERPIRQVEPSRQRERSAPGR